MYVTKRVTIFIHVKNYFKISIQYHSISLTHKYSRALTPFIEHLVHACVQVLHAHEQMLHALVHHLNIHVNTSITNMIASLCMLN